MKILCELKSKVFDFISPLAGLLLTLAFEPFGYWFFSFISLAFIFASWQTLSPKRSALRGLLFGLGYFGSGVSWVFVSVHEFGHASFVISLIVTLFFVLVWASFVGLTGYAAGKALSLLKRPVFFINSSLWILIEYLRGTWFLNGFPWLQVAYSQTDSILAGYAPVLGVYGLGFIVAIISECLISPLALLKRGSKLNLLIALCIGGVMLNYYRWTYPVGDELQVSLVQGNIPQDKKWDLSNRDVTLKKYRELTQQNWQSEIVIWPETAIPAYYSEVKDGFLTLLQNEALQNKTDIIISLPVKEENGDKFNAVMVLGKDWGTYRKNHLLPFGEYLPLQPLSGYIFDRLNLSGLGRLTSGGDQQQMLKAAGYSFMTSICYEDTFGNEQRKGLPNAAFLVNVTNDAWFGNSIEPHQHLQIARMRAIETGRYLLRATNTGVSAIVDPNGKIKATAPQFETAVITAKILPMAGMTPYARLGDDPIMIWILLSLMISFWLNKNSKSNLV
ncbi:MAG: apolipoprotein N-acyltransferase [Methylicorpusculum sp.]|uniref:apolipoprotein N-acyltransferase n=1 Tax=Methylicorpusculum sp. TaxID=2713644 RepID=UPI00271F17AD|nr:apolipoprotein N-acyltransferase [Methylicorpusculum sp.]MDO8940087.1 apolipoprotein N-acyltransferase [Methylicorpusculum sp.]MDP2203377.1 apolipoprotein N-acyltransferase [Methylicorpusculum sp.]